MQRSLLALALVAMLASAAAQNATAGGVEVPEVDVPEEFNPREAISNLVEYQEEHPNFAAGVATWLTVGTIIFLLAFILFLYSEIKAVLVARDQDFRKKLIEDGYMSNGANFNELFEREAATMAPRPYLSVGAMLLMFIAFACLLYPLCDILTIIGLPSAPCLLIITFGAFFASICLATFWMFVIWSCTRTYAALVFLVMSLTGQILLPTGNPILLLVWVVLAFGGGYMYFYFGPDYYKEKPEDKPMWLQDVGDFTVSTNYEEWGSAFNKAYEAETAALQKQAEALKKQAEEAQKTFEEQQKKLTENTPLNGGSK
mmetsp:Transcript_19826/g.45629  ORF Transcript_19826/g.45629 Transcript_19826/m.45629 type:complete len:315 (+) Transcript_19826:10-954(+)